jgi:hypothetical protein
MVDADIIDLLAPPKADNRQGYSYQEVRRSAHLLFMKLTVTQRDQHVVY